MLQQAALLDCTFTLQSRDAVHAIQGVAMGGWVKDGRAVGFEQEVRSHIIDSIRGRGDDPKGEKSPHCSFFASVSTGTGFNVGSGTTKRSK